MCCGFPRMSWQLFSAPAANLSSRSHVRFTARAAALLQVVNPKTWMMALAVVSLFAPASDHALRDITLMALWFLAISVVCLLCWAWLGKAVNRIFRTTVAMVRFQRAMALCLFISALGWECWLRSVHHPYDTARTAKYLPPDGAPYPHPPRLRFTSMRLRQPSSTSSICFATIAGSSTSSVVSSSCVNSCAARFC